MTKKAKKAKFLVGGPLTIVPASRQNIDQRTPSGVRPVVSPVLPIKSDVVGAMKHGGEFKMKKKSVKRMAIGGLSAPMGAMDKSRGQPGKGRPPGGKGQGPGANPGRGPGQGKGMGPGQGKGPAPGGGQGKGPVPGGFMGGGAGQGQGKGGAPGQGKGPGPGGPGMRYPMGPNGGPAGPRNLYPSDMGMGSVPGPGLGAGGMPRVGMGLGNINQGLDMSGVNQGMGPGGQPTPEYANFMMQRMAQRQAPQPMASMVGASGRAPGMKKGGKVSASSYNDMTAGSGSGLGRLQKTSIASKTKAQKLKKGGKVKGYYDGGDINSNGSGGLNLSYGDMLAAQKAGVDPNAGNRRDAALAAYQARQDAAEKAARRRRAAPASPPPASSAGNAAGEALRRARNAPPRSEERVRTDRPRSQSQASSDPFAIDMRRMSDPIREYQRTHDRYGRKLDENGRPLDYAGNPIAQKKGGKVKMAKGGKAEAFEGTAKDMAQDKKLAKKHGMSLKDYERSSIDKKHDEQRSMKGLKKGGMAKKMASGGSSDPYSDLAARKEVRAKGKAPDFATAFFGPSIRDSSDTRAKLRDIGRRTGLPDTRNQEDTKAGKMSKMKKGGKVVHDKGCKCMACGGMAKYAMGGEVSTSQTGMKKPLRPTPSAMAKGGKVTFGSMKPLPGTKTVGPLIRSTVATGANMKKDGMKGQLRAKASGAKPSKMMKPLGMTKMAKGGKVRGAGIAQRGTKFIGEV